MFRRVLLLAVAVPASTVAVDNHSFINGIATAYHLDKVSSGNCNFMYDSGIGQNYAAVNDMHWDSTRNCGRCAHVTCVDSRCSDKTKSVLVHIVDRCRSCQPGGLDLSPTVYKQLTGSAPSDYKIKWTFVDCPVTGNIKYCTKGGSSNSWLAVQPTNFATGVASVQIANQDVTMVDSCYYFLLNGGSNVDISAVDIKLTSLSGETITETLSLEADKCTDGKSNFKTRTNQDSPNQAAPVSPSGVTPAPRIHPPVVSPPTVTAPSTLGGAPTPPTTMKGSTPASPPSYNFKGDTPSRRKEPNKDSNKPQTPQGNSRTDYKAGKVIAPTGSTTPVTILQSNEKGVDNHLGSDPTKQTEAEQIATKSQAASSGTSPVLVALVVLAVVGVLALAAVAYSVKKKRKLENKCIDRDEAVMRSFDTFSSPVQFEQTIAKI